MFDKEKAREEVKKLVERFKENISQYRLTSYKEAQVRTEFIDKFFIALGWDVTNEEGSAEQYKEVINEDSIKISGRTKAPDYAFRLGGTRIFFVEAKKPSVKIKEKIEPAFQLRRYAWNIKIPLSILTDFEELAIYDCRVKPNPKDKAGVSRILYFTYDQYIDNFDKIWGVFSKEAVLKGSFDRFVKSSKDKKGTSEVDTEFLKEIEKWRETLAKNIALRNSQLTISELNYSVQKLINRLLFLRIAEDRGIEKYEKLKRITEDKNVYRELTNYFIYADEKYNSGIFDFDRDKITPTLNIDGKILKSIVLSTYYPYSPYDFSILSIEILGSVYERFLGKTIRLTKSHQVKIEDKPEVKKAGGVYYTPEFIVGYVVKETVGKTIEGKSPSQIRKLRILDPACGSGTFLVRAYSYLLDYHLNWYISHDPKKHKKEVYQYRENQWFLTTEVKKRILLSNIFGVDIDPQAVEITKLSLLLKALENETKENVEQQTKLVQDRVLPNLDKNIKCGNSVVDSSYFEQSSLIDNHEEMLKVNVFDWDSRERGFGEIIGEEGFDIILGNPPYVKEYTNKTIFENVKKTTLNKYYQGKMDFWYFFTCKAIDLLKDGGLHSFIAQNNWVTSAGASILRNKILSNSKIISFFDFNDFRIFKNASIQTMVFVLEKKKSTRPYSVDYYKIVNKTISKEELNNYLLTKRDGGKIEKFKAKIYPKELIDKPITFTNSQVSNILEKMRSQDIIYLMPTEITNGLQVQQDFVNKNSLKKLGSGFKIGDGIFVLSEKEKENLNLQENEGELIKPLFTPEEIERYNTHFHSGL